MSIEQLPDPNAEAITYLQESAAMAPATPVPSNESDSAFLQLFLAICTWLISSAFLLFVPVVVALPYLIYKGSVENGLRPETLMADKTFILFSLLGIIPAHVLSVFIAWAVVTWWGRRPFWETIRWSWPENFGPGKRVLLALLAVALLALGSLITKFLGGSETQIDQLINSSFGARIATAFLAAATAPFVEEVIYRGVLYSAFERIWGTVWAVLIVSVMFAGVHVWQYSNNLGVIAVITMLSVTLTLVRALTGRLLPCFVMHLVFNGIQSIYIVISPFLESTQQTDKTAGLILHLIGFFLRPLG